MSNPYDGGTFFWYWYQWWFPVFFAVVALAIGVGILITTDRKRYGVIVRVLALLAFVGTFTLAQERIGFGIKADEEMVAVINMLGGFGSIIVGAVHFMVYGRRREAAQAEETAPSTPAQGTVVDSAGTMTGVAPGEADQLAQTGSAAADLSVEAGGGMTLVQGADALGTSPVAEEVAPPAWLVFQSGPNAGQTIPLSGTETTIGRGADNDIVVDDEGVSRQHAAITFVGGEYRLADVGSASGTLLDGSSAETAVPLESGATVRLGETDLLFMQGQPGVASETPSSAAATEPPAAPAPSGDAAATIVAPPPEPEETLMAWLAVIDGPSKGLTCQVKAGETRIGRGDDNDLIIGDAGVSRNHAMVVGSDSGMILLDLASSGGTRLNGEALRPAELSTTSVITIGETELMLIGVESAPESAGLDAAGSADATIVAAPATSKQGGVLVARKGPDAGKTFQLVEGDNVIGRGEATVQLSDPQASRRHAVIRRSGDKFIVYDLGSTAGTIVDGQKVEGIKIKGTDKITLGSSTIVVMEPNAG